MRERSPSLACNCLKNRIGILPFKLYCDNGHMASLGFAKAAHAFIWDYMTGAQTMNIENTIQEIDTQALPENEAYEAPAVEELGRWETVTGSPG